MNHSYFLGLVIFVGSCSLGTQAPIETPTTLKVSGQVASALAQDESLINKIFSSDDPSSLKTLLKVKKTLGKDELLRRSAAIDAPNCASFLLSQGASIESSRSGKTPLFIATENGSLETLEVLLNQGALTEQAFRYVTPLSVACEKGDLRAVKLLVEAGAELDRFGKSTLLYAIEGGSQELVEYVLSQGAEYHWGALASCIVPRRTPLLKFFLERGEKLGIQRAFQVAARAENLEALELLIAYGADINGEEFEMPIKSALYLFQKGADVKLEDLHARALVTGKKKLLEEIEENVYDFSLGRAFHSLESKNYEKLETLLSSHPELVLREIFIESFPKSSLLDVAVETRDLRAVELLLARGAKPSSLSRAVRKEASLEVLELLVKANPGLAREDDSVLSLAVENQRADLARVLLEAGAPSHARLLFQAAGSTVLQRLLDAGLSPNYQSTDGYTPLRISATRSLESTKVLLEAGASADTVDVNGLSALYFATINYAGESPQTAQKDVLEMKKLLLKAGAPLEDLGLAQLFIDLNFGKLSRPLVPKLLERKNDRGETPLEFVVKKGDSKQIERLLSVGSNPQTALKAAVLSQDRKLITRLLEAGAKLNIHTLSALAEAHTSFDPMFGDFLLQNGLVVRNGKHRNSDPLIKAASRSPVMIKWLLEKGCNPNVTDTKGQTPLHHAVRESTTLRLLLEAGASVQAQDENGDLPLHLACKSDRSTREAVMQLLKAGSAVDIPNNKGETPLSLAIDSDDEKLLKVLQPQN